MIGDLYIYSNTFNSDTNIFDLSSNNFTIMSNGLSYHSTTYTSTTPRFFSSIVIPHLGSFYGDTGVLLGSDTDFTFDIYINYLWNQYNDEKLFFQFGYINFYVTSENYNIIQLKNGITNTNLYSYIQSPCLLTITRESGVMKLFKNGLFIGLLTNFNIGNSVFQAYNQATTCVINTIRIINGISLYNTNFSMPTFPYTDGENITGQVTENDIGVIRTIRLYNRNNGLLTYTTVSNADGSYEIPILNNDVEYDVVFLDDTAGYTYNDIIKRTSLI